MIAMILAAGRGERLRPLTDETPKALMEVQGRTLLERHLDKMKAAGIETVIINLGWHGEQILTRVGGGQEYGVNVIYSPEGDNILETGGGIHRALPLLGCEPSLVVNADIITDMPLPPAGPGEDDLCHLVLVPTPPHKAHGDFDLHGDRVVDSEQASLTFSGVAIYRPEFFADCEPGRFPLAPMLKSAARAGNVKGSCYEGFWEDVGTPERLAMLNR